jgi:peptidoglycan/xylan/chitin deacetylase (PgdA/CDA1 family)
VLLPGRKPESDLDSSQIRAAARGGSCVLTFHRVVDHLELDHDLHWRSFLDLLDYIAAEGIPVSTELADPERTPGSLVLTFDDATADHARVADELSSRGWAGVFFVPVELLGTTARLTAPDVSRLAEVGHLVGSHMLDHRRIDDIDLGELARQVAESKTRLEVLAQSTVDYFAPPGGSYNPHLPDLLDDAGYTASRSTRWSFYRSALDRWNVPCLPVTHYTWQRGWIERALTDWRLPPVMRIVWGIKCRLPRAAVVRIRARLARPT